MTMLNPREAYRLWAPSYAAETAISALDEEMAAELLQGLPCTHLLDAGCGIGRRLKDAPGLAIGVDASPEMLQAGGGPMLAAADVCALPFASGAFDMVWCRLVLGHLADPVPAYRELARVCAPSGHVLVSDFHPDAARAGHRRSFRDATGVVRDVEHHIHAVSRHEAMANAAGLTLAGRHDGAIGPSIRDFYARANRLAAYDADLGLNVVAAFLFRRACAS